MQFDGIVITFVKPIFFFRFFLLFFHQILVLLTAILLIQKRGKKRMRIAMKLPPLMTTPSNFHVHKILRRPYWVVIYHSYLFVYQLLKSIFECVLATPTTDTRKTQLNISTLFFFSFCSLLRLIKSINFLCERAKQVRISVKTIKLFYFSFYDANIASILQSTQLQRQSPFL